jgi:ketosteroid isomerase-like protein
MPEHPGITRVREYLEIFATGDLEALRDFYSEDILWHVGGNHPLSGDYRGRDELFGYFETVRNMTGGSLELDPESILASDHHVAMFTRVTGRRGDKTMDVLLAQVFKLGDDGRWSEYWATVNNQASVDEFWS